MVLRLVITCLLITTATADVTTELQGMMFLYRFGYITEKDMTHVSNLEDQFTKDMMKEALEEYQERSGLKITGTLDNDTMAEMSLPRCGVKDIIPLAKEDVQPEQLRRAKRYVLGSTRWGNPNLSYRFIRTQRGNQARQEFQTEMDRAFQAWSDVSPLAFRRVTSRREAVDIEILFAAGNHGDNSNFDGPSHANGAVLAHAFYPRPGIGGDIHFDDEENWVTNSSRGVDFYSVALHELGHSIGLDHSTFRNAIMYPSYTGYRPVVRLHRDDIAGVTALYGSRGPPGRRPSRTRPSGQATPGAPSLCELTHIDAAFNVPNSQDVYIFSGQQCYLLQEGMTGKTTEGYPRPISTEFPGVQVTQRVDAALVWPNGQVFIFERNNVWIHRDGVLQTGPARPISEVFPGIPSNLDAACFWPGDQLTYFFKGDQYWRYDNTTSNPVKAYFPRPIRRWGGVSGSVDAVLAFGPDTYFFQNAVHYRYNNRALRMYPDYPRPTRDNLFACNSEMIPPDDDEAQSGLVETAESSCPKANENPGTDKGGIGGRSKKPKPKTSPPSAGSDHSSCLLLVTVLSFIITALGCEL